MRRLLPSSRHGACQHYAGVKRLPAEKGLRRFATGRLLQAIQVNSTSSCTGYYILTALILGFMNVIDARHLHNRGSSTLVDIDQASCISRMYLTAAIATVSTTMLVACHSISRILN
jgi:hypothetical protein